MLQNLPQKRLTDFMEIHQIHRPAGTRCEFGYQSNFLAGR